MNHLKFYKSLIGVLIVCVLCGCGYARQAKKPEFTPKLEKTLSEVQAVLITGTTRRVSNSLVKRLRDAGLHVTGNPKTSHDLKIEFELTLSYGPTRYCHRRIDRYGDWSVSQSSNCFQKVTLFSLVHAYDGEGKFLCRDKFVFSPRLPKRTKRILTQNDVNNMALDIFIKQFDKGYVAQLVDKIVSNRKTEYTPVPTLSPKQQNINPATKELLALFENLNLKDVPEIKKLIKTGADLNVVGNGGMTPLYKASLIGFTDIVKLLIEANADVNAAGNNGATPLYIASQNGSDDIVKLLLDANANVNRFKINDRGAPLYTAAQNGRTKVVKLLLQANAKVNVKNKYGETPLYTASLMGHTDVVKLLIEAKAKVDAPKYNGQTPLYTASRSGHTDIVKLLIDGKADVNAVRSDGSSALHIASYKNYPEIVKLLLKANADIDAKKRDGETALSIAKKHGNTEVAQLIKSADQ